MIEIYPLPGIGEVAPGDDLAAMLGAAIARQAPDLLTTDVLVVTSKIVSKMEGRYAKLGTIVPDAAAGRLAAVTGKDPRLVALALQEASAVVRAAPQVLITRHRLGFVMANSGIDQSNLGPGRDGWVLLLPEDPDGSATQLRNDMIRMWGRAPAILLSDSFGRPWRQGVTNVALGASGLPALIDQRGERDRDGRAMEMTQIAFADLLASAAGLAMGEAAEGTPAVLVRGLTWTAVEEGGARALIRPIGEDLFR